MLSADSSNKIKTNVAKLLSIYKDFRLYNSLEYKFWDVVVLTALDETQKGAYEACIRQKLLQQELPRRVEYVVVADPEGSKVGCGGATMHAIHQLHGRLGDRLFSKRVLLINTGGYSKRLPSASVLGKVFVTVPLEDELWTLLDLKLALYLPFIQRMTPGVFQTCSDTIELFHVDWGTSEGPQGDGGWDFCQPGFTALAHPSRLHIGCSHGVFVVDGLRQDLSTNLASFELIKCSEVLQKPSLEELEEKNAVLKRTNENGETEAFVYTDSSFFFDHQISREFIEFYSKHKPLCCEINGYEEFMKSLTAPKQFIQESKNNPTVSESLLQIRVDLAGYLQHYDLHVLALNDSEFFHLGTMQECIEHLNPQGRLGSLMSWRNVVLSGYVRPFNIHESSVSIHNLFQAHTDISQSVVVEYCHFDCPLKINENCMVSNCHVGGDDLINIPENTFIHTVAVKIPEKAYFESTKYVNTQYTQYVTLVFHLQDDLKKVHDNVESFSQKHKHSLMNCIRNDVGNIRFTDQVCSLWNARLFPCMESMHDSFQEALKMMHSNSPAENHHWFSAADIMACRDINDILEHRLTLRKLINSIKNNNNS